MKKLFLRVLVTLVLLGLAVALALTLLALRRDQRELGLRRQLETLHDSEMERLHGVIAHQEQQIEDNYAEQERPRIEAAVSRIHRLHFKEKVVYEQLPRAQFRAAAEQKMKAETTDEEIAQDTLGMEAMGLLPPGFDLEKAYLDLLSEQVGAFYDERAHKVFTFTGSPLDRPLNQVTLAHELTHALQDQHFNLSSLPMLARENDDEALAATALVEGDATLLMNDFMAQNVSAQTLTDSLALMATQRMDLLQKAPPILRESLYFPYTDGQKFCAALVENGGYSEINAAFDHPPRTTAEIYHPERFLARPRFIARLQIPPDRKFQPVRGQQPAAVNVMGEFSLRVLLEQVFSADEAARLAAGWRGDYFAVYGSEKSNSYTWEIAWDEQPGAFAELEGALEKVNAARYKIVFPKDAAGGPVTATTSSGRIITLRPLAGSTLRVTDAADAEWNAALRNGSHDADAHL